jgi:hypothetical protein
MPTIINNPSGESDSGLGMVLGVIIALILIALFFVYGLPALRNASTPQSGGTTNIQVEVPTPSVNTGSNSAPSSSI